MYATMKKTTKFIAIAAAAVTMFFTTQVKAQTSEPNKWRLGIGVEGGIPTGSLHGSDGAPDYSKFELGGTARLQYGVAKNFALTLTSGYYNFFATDAAKAAGGESFGVVPVKLGGKIFFNSPIYFGGELGAGFETKYAKNTKFLWSPALGWANRSWDVGVRYEGFQGQSDNYGIVALRIAYGFSL
jgi:hypothetical protein